MNLIRKKSPFKYFANSEFRNVDNKIQLVGDVEPIELQALGRKATLDYMFLCAVQDVLFPNTVLIVDSPFIYIDKKFVIPIYNFLLEYLPQIIFLKTHFHKPNFEINQGRAYELVLNTKYTSATIKRFETSKN